MKPLVIGVLAMVGVGAAALGLVAQAPRGAHALPAPANDRITAPIDHEVAAEIERDMRRFALNALLVPVLDTDDPPRWQDPSLAMACGAGTRVLVDGLPLEPRAAAASSAFTLQWSMDGCLPFGLGGPEMSGRADLVVFRNDDGLSAIVQMTDLQVQHRGQAIVMNTTFVARTP
jgi:hypothetical protein